MKTSHTLIGIAVSLALAAGMLFAGSQGSITHDGNRFVCPLRRDRLCSSLAGYLFPHIAFQTEHYFDLTGGISYITTVIVAVYLNPQLDIRDQIIAAMIAIWAFRLSSFLFWRIKKDGQDKRFVVMKTKFTWFLMTWTLGGLWGTDDHGRRAGCDHIE